MLEIARLDEPHRTSSKNFVIHVRVCVCVKKGAKVFHGKTANISYIVNDQKINEQIDTIHRVVPVNSVKCYKTSLTVSLCLTAAM